MNDKIENMLETLERDKENIFLVLNENIGQILIAVRLLFYEATYGEGNRSEMTETCRKYLDLAIDDLKELLTSFWPYSIYNIRFSEAMKSLVYEIVREKPIVITWQIKHETNESISLTKKLMICRILEEQLKNILHNPFVKNVVIKYNVTYGHIILSIADHSDHFYDISSYHSNELEVIRDRVEMFEGRFSLSFRTGVGNLLFVRLPL
ncbi:MAG: hypothetical protein ABUT20_31065 [Bacteroidota bacterium]